MKLRIVQCQLYNNLTYYKVEKKYFLFPIWSTCKIWYIPEIVGMPGQWKTLFETIEEAEEVIQLFKNKKHSKNIFKSQKTVKEVNL